MGLESGEEQQTNSLLKQTKESGDYTSPKRGEIPG
jgi:hypothetical protein